jgi:hypothetical protein
MGGSIVAVASERGAHFVLRLPVSRLSDQQGAA